MLMWPTDDSEDSDMFGEEGDEDSSTKSGRLEENRTNLEKELGEKTFMKAYSIIQVRLQDSVWICHQFRALFIVAHN